MYLGVSHASRPKSATAALPIFGVLCLCMHPLTQNDQIWHGATCFKQSATPSIPRWCGPSRPQFCGFFTTYPYIVWPEMTKFGVVTYGGVLGWQPHDCICTNESRGLSAIAKFLVCVCFYTHQPMLRSMAIESMFIHNMFLCQDDCTYCDFFIVL